MLSKQNKEQGKLLEIKIKVAIKNNSIDSEDNAEEISQILRQKDRKDGKQDEKVRHLEYRTKDPTFKQGIGGNKII